MTDRDLNRLMAEVMGWRKLSKWYIRDVESIDPERIVPIRKWQPETRVEQAMMVVERMEKQGLLVQEAFIENLRHQAKSSEDWGTALWWLMFNANLAEAICLAVEAAMKEGKDVG